MCCCSVGAVPNHSTSPVTHHHFSTASFGLRTPIDCVLCFLSFSFSFSFFCSVRNTTVLSVEACVSAKMLRHVVVRSTFTPLSLSSRLYSTTHNVAAPSTSSSPSPSSGQEVQIPSPAVASSSSSSGSVLHDAAAATAPRTDWSRDHIRQIYDSPLHELTYAAVSPCPLSS